MRYLLTPSARLRLFQSRATSYRPAALLGSLGVLLDALHERIFQGDEAADQFAGGRSD